MPSSSANTERLFSHCTKTNLLHYSVYSVEHEHNLNSITSNYITILPGSILNSQLSFRNRSATSLLAALS